MFDNVKTSYGRLVDGINTKANAYVKKIEEHNRELLKQVESYGVTEEMVSDFLKLEKIQYSNKYFVSTKPTKGKDNILINIVHSKAVAMHREEKELLEAISKDDAEKILGKIVFKLIEGHIVSQDELLHKVFHLINNAVKDNKALKLNRKLNQRTALNVIRMLVEAKYIAMIVGNGAESKRRISYQIGKEDYRIKSIYLDKATRKVANKCAVSKVNPSIKYESKAKQPDVVAHYDVKAMNDSSFIPKLNEELNKSIKASLELSEAMKNIEDKDKFLEEGKKIRNMQIGGNALRTKVTEGVIEFVKTNNGVKEIPMYMFASQSGRIFPSIAYNPYGSKVLRTVMVSDKRKPLIALDAISSGMTIMKLLFGKVRTRDELLMYLDGGFHTYIANAVNDMLKIDITRDEMKKLISSGLSYGKHKSTSIKDVVEYARVNKEFREKLEKSKVTPQHIVDTAYCAMFQFTGGKFEEMAKVFNSHMETTAEVTFLLPDGFRAVRENVVTVEESVSSKLQINWNMIKTMTKSKKSIQRTAGGTIHTKVHTNKNRNEGLLATLVHSIDAYIMRQLMNNSKFYIFPIHDCFMIEEENEEALQQAYKEVLIDMLKNNELQNIIDSMTSRVVKGGVLAPKQSTVAMDVSLSKDNIDNIVNILSSKDINLLERE